MAKIKERILFYLFLLKISYVENIIIIKFALMIGIEFDINNPLFYVLSFLTLLTIIILVYYYFVFTKLAFYKPPPKKNNREEGVSIVICAHNECHVLVRHLPLILTQNYPNYEVIVVDDNSDDDTVDLLKQLQDQHKHLRYISLDNEKRNFFKGKKFPLALGIKEAKNEILLLTDADCIPESEMWLKNMQSHFNDDIDIVLGYGAYDNRKTLLNRFIRFDTIHTAMQYFSFALSGVPYMGVGRNLAYRKSLFIKNKGFSSHYHVLSGDDDLFINQVANKKNIAIEIAAKSHTISVPKRAWRTWFKQKRRHLTTGKHYKKKHQLMLGLYGLSLFLFYVLSIVLLALNYNIIIVIALLLLKLFSWLIIFKKTMIRLNESNLLLISPIIELITAVFMPFFIATNKFIKSNTWK